MPEKKLVVSIDFETGYEQDGNVIESSKHRENITFYPKKDVGPAEAMTRIMTNYLLSIKEKKIEETLLPHLKERTAPANYN